MASKFRLTGIFYLDFPARLSYLCSVAVLALSCFSGMVNGSFSTPMKDEMVEEVDHANAILW